MDYIQQNKEAWEYSAYDFWVSEAGSPAQRAKRIAENPLRELKQYSVYFDGFQEIKVANICGSCGKKAVPLSVLGAEVTVFDISTENRRYAMELADALQTPLEYELGDVLKIDLNKYGSQFDIVFMEGGVLHYFHELSLFMDVMYGLLKPGGKMICSDFHPYTKIMDTLELEQPTMDYFSKDTFESEMAHARFFPEEVRQNIPKCVLRKYTVSEIINASIGSGFRLERFDEHPAWNHPELPGEFTLVAKKEQT